VDGRRRERLWRAIGERVTAAERDGWAQAVCVVGATSIEGMDAAVLTLRAQSHAQQMLGASDDWGAGLGQAQYTLGEGPAVDAFTTDGPVLVADLSRNQARWPGFAEAALGAGAGAVFAFPLRLGGIRMGTLEFYRRRRGALSASEQADAAILADLATQALLDHAHEVAQTGHEWVHPVESYQDVNVATGMLAAQLHVSLDDAFARLRAHAFTTRRSVLDVAKDILAQRLRLDQPTD
jgi:hypothetical protein